MTARVLAAGILPGVLLVAYQSHIGTQTEPRGRLLVLSKGDLTVWLTGPVPRVHPERNWAACGR